MAINFNKDINMKDRIDTLARYIIVHSIIYYDYNANIISDKEYDEASKLLAFLKNTYPQIAEECYYWEVIKDFDGTTGFDLKDKLKKNHREYLEHIARNVLMTYKGEYRVTTK